MAPLTAIGYLCYIFDDLISKGQMEGKIPNFLRKKNKWEGLIFAISNTHIILVLIVYM